MVVLKLLIEVILLIKNMNQICLIIWKKMTIFKLNK